jgi:hypothetical protein
MSIKDFFLFGSPKKNTSRLCAHGVVVAFSVTGLPTNQVHQWAHMRRPPRWVRWFQACGVILAAALTGQHHRIVVSPNSV